VTAAPTRPSATERTGPMRMVPAWTTYAQMAARKVYIYRMNVIFGIVLTGVTIYLLTVVWRTGYAGRSEVNGIAIGQLLTYLTIANLQVRFLTADVDEDIRERIREGQIAFDINRPTPFPSMLMAGAAGKMLGMVPMLVIGLPVALVAGELRPPPTLSAGLGYAVSLLLAWVIAVELNLAMGLIAFWTLELTGFQMMYRLVGQFCTGALIPLWFMPGAVRDVVQALPWQAMGFLPVSIYVGEPVTGSLITALGVQLLWMVVLLGIITWVWRMAFRNAVIQGG
jgi:viologen exporter family transport system permease protein